MGYTPALPYFIGLGQLWTRFENLASFPILSLAQAFLALAKNSSERDLQKWIVSLQLVEK